MQIDEIDNQLLALLKENARTPVATLARKLGLARTTVQTRIERLEAGGSITGYTLRKGGAARPALRATALLSVAPRSGPAVLARLQNLPNIEAAHTTSGRWDMLVTLTAQNTEALDETLDEIAKAKGVQSSESLIHLSTKLDRS